MSVPNIKIQRVSQKLPRSSLYRRDYVSVPESMHQDIQNFLIMSSARLENNKMEKSFHPTMHLTHQKKVLKPRSPPQRGMQQIKAAKRSPRNHGLNRHSPQTRDGGNIGKQNMAENENHSYLQTYAPKSISMKFFQNNMNYSYDLSRSYDAANQIKKKDSTLIDESEEKAKDTQKNAEVSVKNTTKNFERYNSDKDDDIDRHNTPRELENSAQCNDNDDERSKDLNENEND